MDWFTLDGFENKSMIKFRKYRVISAAQIYNFVKFEIQVRLDDAFGYITSSNESKSTREIRLAINQAWESLRNLLIYY